MGVTVNFTGGANRPDQPHPSVMAALEAAANASLPSGSTVTVYSGTGEYGSSRHRGSTGYLGQTKFGLAADVNVSLPGGKKATAAEMKALGQAWASITKGGVGYGKNYMGVDNIHLDLVTQDMLGPKQGMTWGGETAGWDLADYRNGTKTFNGLSPTMLADANVPVPANKPEDFQVTVADLTSRPTGNPWSGLFSQPTAAARDFSGVTSDELALSLAPNANIAPSGILGSPLTPAPAPEVQRAMLDSLPGALPAAPVSPVSVASLDPVTQYSSLPAAPVQEVTSAPLRDVPANVYSAPVGPVERGLLSDLPSALNAAPVGAVERGGMLAPAQERSFTGNPNLTEANPDAFEGYWTYNGTPVTAIAPTASPDSWDISTAPGADFMMSRTGGPVGPVSAEPFGNVNAPYSGDYALADSLSFSDYANPMGAPLGSVQTHVTPDQNFGAVAPAVDQETIAASISPVAEPYSMFGVGPADPNMTLNAQTPTYGGINAMTALSNAAMANLPAIDPNVPLDLTSIPVPATKPLAPLAPPVEVPQYKVASPAQTQQAPVQAMSVPSGMDVWSGMSNYGVATDGSTLSRNPNGTVTRTSAKYGNVETYNPATDRWSPGAPKTNAMGTVGNTLTNPTGISMPSKERVGSFAKGIAGGAAGAAVGGALGLGPIGAMLGAALGRSLAQGQGVSGMFGQSTSMFPGAPGPGTGLTQTDQARIAKTFGYSGATPGAGDPMSRGYSPAAHDSIGRGETVGLF